MAKMYAWSNFDVERNEWGQTTNVIHVGDEVTQANLNISDDDWAELVATGAVREEPYPDVPADVPPAQYLRERLATGDATEEEVALAGKLQAFHGTADTDSKLALGFDGFGLDTEEQQAKLESMSLPTETDDSGAEVVKPEATSGEGTTSSGSSSSGTPKTTTASTSKSGS